MKLSEAIRLGATLKPQGFGMKSMSGVERTCALGAAADAIGCGEVGRYTAVTQRWPLLGSVGFECPACGGIPQPEVFRSVVWHLNDRHRWTREQIADWVATIEPSESSVDITHTADAVKELIGGSGRSGA